jgi:hypothetical protein
VNVDPVTGEVMSSSKEKPMPQHPKTVGALKAEQSSTWNVVDAMVDEFEFGDEFEHGELRDLITEMQSAGVEKDPTTIRHYGHAAKVMSGATPAQAKLMRSAAGVKTLGILGQAGFSPEAIVAEIRPGSNLSKRHALAIVAELNQAKRAAAGIPERTVDYDAKIQSACSAIIDTLAAVRDGDADLDAMTWMYVHTTARAMQSSVADDFTNVTVDVDSGLAAIEEFLATNG